MALKCSLPPCRGESGQGLYFWERQDLGQVGNWVPRWGIRGWDEPGKWRMGRPHRRGTSRWGTLVSLWDGPHGQVVAERAKCLAWHGGGYNLASWAVLGGWSGVMIPEVQDAPPTPISAPSTHVVFNKDFLYLPPTQAKGGAQSGAQDTGCWSPRGTVHGQTLRVDAHLPVCGCAQDSRPHPWT